MRPFDLGDYALGAVRAHRQRSLLTVLGIAVGIATVVLLDYVRFRFTGASWMPPTPQLDHLARADLSIHKEHANVHIPRPFGCSLLRLHNQCKLIQR